jgi:adenosylcobinamide-GDP ribazoletransferase
VSRWALVYAIFAYPYARVEGLGKAYKQGTGWQEFLFASLVTFVLSVILFKVAGPIIIAGTCLTVTMACLYFNSRIHGLTGDIYGAVNEIALVTILLVINILAFKNWLL